MQVNRVCPDRLVGDRPQLFFTGFGGNRGAPPEWTALDVEGRQSVLVAGDEIDVDAPGGRSEASNEINSSTDLNSTLPKPRS